MAEEKIIIPEDDDWLNDLQDVGSKSTADEVEGLGQSDIDQLLDGGLGEQEEGAAGVPQPSMEIEGLDQNQVDELLGSLDDEEEELPPPPPAQDEIDQLFDEARSVEEKSVPQQAARSEAEFDSFDLDFDTIEADDFGFDEEIATIPEESVSPPPAAEEKKPAKPKKPAAKGARRAIPWLTKKNLAMAAGLALLVGFGTFGYLRLTEKPPPAIPVVVPKPVPVAKVEPPPPNQVPEAEPGQYSLAESEGEVEITLAGRDAEGAPLTYEVSRLPRHGELAGEPPQLTYLPGRDFPGQDAFEYTVSDGRQSSPPVAVIITGPDRRQQQAQATAPKRPLVTAVNVTMQTLSTDDLLIDWAKIWGQTNRAGFSDRVKVHIEKGPQHGSLTTIDHRVSHYQPEITFGGKDVIRYRFEKDGRRSKARLLKLMVVRGDLPPEPELRPLARTLYLPGETVVLDGSPSRDDNRGSLEFNWQQLAGTPVLFNKLNDEGSVVSFVVPSSFQRGGPASLRFQLTVVDRLDQLASAEVEIQAGSRRQTALWRGSSAGGVVPEPACPEGNCLDAHLPWPSPSR